MKKLLSLGLILASLSFADIDSMRARAPQISDYKDKGVLGEQVDGYLGLVKEDAKAKELMLAENADRKEEYQKRATQQSQSLEVFAKVIGEAKVRQEKPGRMVRKASGEWEKK